MDYDLLIKGGSILDGTGSAAFTADVAIKDGIIVEVGKAGGVATRVIDADGLLVTPGFIDIHTHYDAQALWDSDLETSTRHGVTTAVMGNCGVGFAPLGAGMRDAIINLMAGVEDIPGDVLREGLDWDWTSFSEYLDRLDAVARPIDIVAQVPHDAVRLFAMGERALRHEQATADDLATMREAVREGLAAGAFGFSFGRVLGHKMSDGSTTPSYHADHAELEALASVLRDLPYRTLQGVTDGRMNLGHDAFAPEYAFVERMLTAAGRPMSLSLNQKSLPGAENDWLETMALADTLAAQGHVLRFQVGVNGAGAMVGLTSTLDPLLPLPSYRAIAGLPLAERVAALRDPALRARLLAETPVLDAADPGNVVAVHAIMSDLEGAATMLFVMDGTLEPTAAQSVAALAKAAGKPVREQLYDLLLQDGGRSLCLYRRFSYVNGDLSAVHDMLLHPGSMFGLADAGAHLGYVCENAFTTRAMTFWPRDRVRGPRIPLPKVVHMLTGKIADHLGTVDRGRIAVGLTADINVIDYDDLGFEEPYAVSDLPAGGTRFLQDSRGYVAVLKNGIAVTERDRATGARPGSLLRAA
jgi:N-acyl-D-aspartate/D-glutamate deacylase